MTEIKFENAVMERFILSYLIKNKSFFLKVGQYLRTSNFNKKSYFIDSKLQGILNICSVYLSIAKFSIKRELSSKSFINYSISVFIRFNKRYFIYYFIIYINTF